MTIKEISLKDIPRAFDITSLYPEILYCKNDVNTTKELINKVYGRNSKPTIENVIFNDPATIVFWSDDTKTVVKCQDEDEFDPEKGLAMAISKKFFGNKGSYCDVIKKWTQQYYDKQDAETIAKLSVIIPAIAKNNKELFDRAMEKFKKHTKADE